MRHALTLSLLFTMAAWTQQIRTVQLATGLAATTDIQNAGDGSGRLFLVQQNGIIRIWRNGALVSTPFLDISGKTKADGERGLLGLAFPPTFATSKRFYVDYTDLNGNTVIAQYRLSGNADIADASTEIALLHITQPFANHNGGQLRFGPDGYLYIGMGDGGSGGDPQGNGQNLSVLLGKILRLDVESNPGQILIPPDNPFRNTAGARPEIWAYGVRNPWRFSFDRPTHDLWIADVGQGAYEEVDVQPSTSKGGENYGWNSMEGMHCYTAGCSTAGLTLPVVEYTHAGGNCSITGGFVYRGKLAPGLRGLYFYADYCSGRIWSLERQGATWNNQQLLASGFTITTFGEDEAGEIYLFHAGNGSLHRLEGSLAPRFSAASVGNAASFANGMVAGSLASVFTFGVRDDDGSLVATQVPLSTSMGGVSLTVAGAPAPIYSVSNVGGREQVNFQVPQAAAGRSTAAVVVTRDGQSSASVTVPVAAVQPGVYTTDGTLGIVIHAADYSLATSGKPLDKNEFAFVYAEGLGIVTNTPADGAAALAAPLSYATGDIRVTIGGVPCEVPFTGLAPGFVGVYQVNFKVPTGAASGPQDLVITANGVPSPAVRVWIR